MYVLLYIQPEDDFLRAETCYCKLFKIIISYSCVRLYVLMLHLYALFPNSLVDTKWPKHGAKL